METKYKIPKSMKRSVGKRVEIVKKFSDSFKQNRYLFSLIKRKDLRGIHVQG
jgi:hypothetical protein